jgi:DNA-binding MarR family transcriptional regulator
MIEITRGTLEEQIIKILQKTYPITVKELAEKLHLSKTQVSRVLNKFQIKGILKLEPLPGKTYIRLLRNDLSFIGKKHQRKFIKHHKPSKKQENEEYDGIMYS